MQTITWNHQRQDQSQPQYQSQCYYCHRPITRGRPTLLFSTDEPLFIGVSHSTCCAAKLKYEHFQMCPPNRLFADQVAFLMYFFPMFYKLPGRDMPNGELRLSLIALLEKYPASMKKPLSILNTFIQHYRRTGSEWLYEGDLEMDFLKFLGQVQRLVKDKPGDVDVEADFSARSERK